MTVDMTAPVDGGKPFRSPQHDGAVHLDDFDIPELARRVRNAWETDVAIEEEDNLPGVDELSMRMLTIEEWESVCDILDLLPAVSAERDQARSMAMRLEEELHHLHPDDSEKLP